MTQGRRVRVVLDTNYYRGTVSPAVAPRMAISKGASDEVFVLGAYGWSIRIHELIDWVNTSSRIEPIRCSTEKLLRLRRADRVAESVLAGMADGRRDEPVLLCQLAGETWVIDGNHRLEKRRRDGLAETMAIPVPPDILESVAEELGF